jgi:allantoate deiminase
MESCLSAARQVVDRCRLLAQFTEEPGFTTRTFLSPPMHDVHARLSDWMQRAGMTTRVDAVGNLRGRYAASQTDAGRLFIASHLDTVPRAGSFDGVLGVVLAVSLVELLAAHRLKFEIEIVGFSEEEGVCFGIPFLGSRALIGDAADLLSLRDSSGVTVREAIEAFGLDPSGINQARVEGQTLGYLEFHIEQGPVLESLNLPLGLVEGIFGQSRLDVSFEGQANHAGTTPMHLRRDALAGAAEWIQIVEREAIATSGLIATVGRLQADPNARNVIAGCVLASLDVRHANDGVRKNVVSRLLESASAIGVRRGLRVSWDVNLDQAAVPMDAALTDILERAVSASGIAVHRLMSGAGHDAMIVAPHMPAAMLFLRSPGGISHHPDEAVFIEDVAAALQVGAKFLGILESNIG